MQRIFVGRDRHRLLIFFFAALKSNRRLTSCLLVISAILLWLTVPVLAETKLSLAEAIDLAEKHSFAVGSARHDSAAAALTYAGARAGRFPVLKVDARSYYIDDLQSIDFPNGRREIGSNDNYQADITLTIPLYTGGKLTNRIGIEREKSRAERTALEAERLILAYQCRKAYLNVMVSQSLLRASSSSLERLTIIGQDIQNLFDNGAADSIDLLEAELFLEQGKQMVDQSHTRFINTSAVLARLLGYDGVDSIIPSETAMPPSQPDYPEPSSESSVDRPELRRFDHIISAADRLAAVESGAYLPNVNGFAGYSYGMPNKDWFQKTWNDYFSVGLSLNWQLNLGGENAKRVQAAQNRAASARMARMDLQDALLTKRDLTFNDMHHAYKLYRNSEKEYSIAERRFNLARLRQQEGQLAVNRLLEMEADLATIEQQYQAAIIQYYLAENEYLYAVGSRKIFGGL